MKRSRLLPTLVLIFSSTLLLAQSDTLTSTVTVKKRIVYFNNLLAGPAFGEPGDGATLSLSTTHGIRYRHFFVGGGVGYDEYDGGWRMMPLFATVGYDFLRIDKHVFFAQVTGGYSKAWAPSDNDWEWEAYSIKVHNGNMVGASLGYRYDTGKWCIYLSGGYKFQRLSYDYGIPTVAEDWNSFYVPSTSVQKDMERFVVQIGFGLH